MDSVPINYTISGSIIDISNYLTKGYVIHIQNNDYNINCLFEAVKIVYDKIYYSKNSAYKHKKMNYIIKSNDYTFKFMTTKINKNQFNFRLSVNMNI